MAKNKRTVVPNRIFLAYQWTIYRPIYERVCTDLHQSTPVYFFALGRPAGQRAEALFERIKSILESSSAAVFDASRGNANVSLEYGMAQFIPHLDCYLLIDQNQLPNHVNPGTPIISDLAGATQNQWDITNSDTLKRHLKAIADDHPYTRRFKRYCQDRGLVKGQFRTPLRVIRQFDEVDSILRRELVDKLLGDKTREEIDELLGDMHDAGLITITPGREWASRVYIA